MNNDGGVQFDEDPMYESVSLNRPNTEETKSELINVLKKKNIIKNSKNGRNILILISVLIFIIAGLIFFFSSGDRSIFNKTYTLPNDAFVVPEDGKLYKVKNGQLQEVK